MRFKQITIIGVGLIGGSIGLAAKKKRLASRVIGVTAHRHTLRKALSRRAIDSGTLNAEKSVSGSDIVILATPVDEILNTLKNVTPHLKKGCIVIDVASVKESIVNRAEIILGSQGFFVGAHPMAGSEQHGVDKADSNLFKGTPCILTRTRKTNTEALKLVLGFWQAMGSKICILSPSDHDRNISAISHLPHIVASALSLVSKPSSMEFASTGFKDTTRIASGNPNLWTSILMANRKNVCNDIKNYLSKLKKLRYLIINGKSRELKRKLSEAKKIRDSLTTR